MPRDMIDLHLKTSIPERTGDTSALQNMEWRGHYILVPLPTVAACCVCTV